MDDTKKGFSLGDWIDSKPVSFDGVAVYDERVLPLIVALRDLCKELGLPFVCAVTVMQNNRNYQQCIAQHFPTPDKLAVGMLAGFHMLQGDADAAIGVLVASEERNGMIEAAAVMPAMMQNVTKH